MNIVPYSLFLNGKKTKLQEGDYIYIYTTSTPSGEYLKVRFTRSNNNGIGEQYIESGLSRYNTNEKAVFLSLSGKNIEEVVGVIGMVLGLHTEFVDTRLDLTVFRLVKKSIAGGQKRRETR